MTDSVDQEIAAQVGAELLARDPTAGALGITLETIGPGTAVMRMTVREDMINCYGACHGGMIFTLADTAFGYAGNSRNRVAVGQVCNITYLEPARIGDVLTASCREVQLGPRSGIYDVEVTDQDGKTLALLRGTSRVREEEAIAGLTLTA